MSQDPAQVIYEVGDATVREAVQALRGFDNATILSSAARTATAGANGPTVLLPHNGFRIAQFLLVLTNAATDADDTLDVYVDTSPDGGNSWVNIVHFTQILGNGADSQKYAAVSNVNIAGDEFDVTSDVAAGATPRNFLGQQLRARYVIVDPTGANATFTFSVVASFK